MWTDGSLTDHTHFATDSGLEGGHCCVKTGARGWRGGTCDALLHGVCESHVSRVLAHPESRDLSVTPGRGLLAVRWAKVTGRGWLPSRWLVSACLVRGIAHVAHEDTCVSEVLQSKAVGVIFKKLSGFSEYNVTVTSYLDHFNQSDSSFKLGRTRNFSSSTLKFAHSVNTSHLFLFPVPDQDYNWTVTLAGELHVTWLRKFSMFQDSVVKNYMNIQIVRTI